MIPSDARAIDLLTEMVGTRSLCGGEDAVAAVLLGAMHELGYGAARRDTAGNVIGEIGTDDAERTIVLLGHMDTVPGVIPVEVRDGSLHGRGSVDAKGPLVTAVIAAARAAATTRARLTVIGAVQEEGPSIGARNLLTMTTPDMLVICEPSGWDSIVLGYKGSQRFTATITIPTTHTAAPEATAAERSFELWGRILAWCEAYPVAESKDPGTFGRLTATLIRTGWCEDGLHESSSMLVGLRLPPGIEPDQVRRELLDLAPEADFDFAAGEAAVRGPRTGPLVSRFVRSIRQEGGTPRYKLKTGTSDMNVVLPVWGCPAVAYGPGDSRLDHTPEEHVILDDYLRAIRILTRVLEEA